LNFERSRAIKVKPHGRGEISNLCRFAPRNDTKLSICRNQVVWVDGLNSRVERQDCAESSEWQIKKRAALKAALAGYCFLVYFISIIFSSWPPRTVPYISNDIVLSSWSLHTERHSMGPLTGSS